jgi:hypothetical protein
MQGEHNELISRSDSVQPQSDCDEHLDNWLLVRSWNAPNAKPAIVKRSASLFAAQVICMSLQFNFWVVEWRDDALLHADEPLKNFLTLERRGSPRSAQVVFAV